MDQKILKFVFISLLVYLGILIVIIIISIINNFKINNIFLDQYNIEIAKPERVEELYREEAGNIAIFEKLIYNKENFNKALEYGYVLEMDTERVLRFVRIRLKCCLTDEGIEKIDEYIDDELLNDSNYYAIFRESNNYYILFIYNIEENSIYSFRLVE